MEILKSDPYGALFLFLALVSCVIGYYGTFSEDNALTHIQEGNMKYSHYRWVWYQNGGMLLMVLNLILLAIFGE